MDHELPALIDALRGAGFNIPDEAKTPEEIAIAVRCNPIRDKDDRYDGPDDDDDDDDDETGGGELDEFVEDSQKSKDRPSLLSDDRAERGARSRRRRDPVKDYQDLLARRNSIQPRRKG